MRDAIKYYGSLVFAAHGASRRWLAVFATWGAYLLAAASALPAVEVALPALTAAWAGPVRWVTIAGIFTVSLAAENWRRIDELQARRSLRLKVLRDLWVDGESQHFAIRLEVVNRGDKLTTLEREWELQVWTEHLRGETTMRGSAVTPLGPLAPGAQEAVTVYFGYTGPDGAVVPKGMPFEVRCRDIYGNSFSLPSTTT